MTESSVERSQAIAKLVRREIAELSPERAAELLLEFWGLDDLVEGETALPEALRAQLRELESPPSFDQEIPLPLIELGLRSQYLGVRNEYLERRLLSDTGCSFAVVGDLEPMWHCPCCGYRCLRERGEYEVCSVCFWEDDGSDALGGYSAPNRMHLAEAIRNFEELGCVDARYLSYLGEDRTERFPRGSSSS